MKRVPYSKPKIGRRPKYDWEVILDGSTRRLTQGAGKEQFTCSPSSMEWAARRHARNRKKRVEVITEARAITITAFPLPSEPDVPMQQVRKAKRA